MRFFEGCAIEACKIQCDNASELYAHFCGQNHIAQSYQHKQKYLKCRVSGRTETDLMAHQEIGALYTREVRNITETAANTVGDLVTATQTERFGDFVHHRTDNREESQNFQKTFVDTCKGFRSSWHQPTGVHLLSRGHYQSVS